jgi:hypothetical protein
VHATRIAGGAGEVRLTCLSVGPGGVIGTHPASAAQLFLVTAGEGWVASQDGARVPIAAGFGVPLGRGRGAPLRVGHGVHAIAVEGAPLGLFEPQAPEGELR